MGPARILVIDDSTSDTHLLDLCLAEQGEAYQLETLSDGEAALQYIREYRSGTRTPEPCVILLDLYLPKHSGLAVLHAIREEPALMHVHVIVLTGSESPHDRAQVLYFGARYWQKPSQLSEIDQLAREIIAICKGAISASA